MIQQTLPRSSSRKVLAVTFLLVGLGCALFWSQTGHSATQDPNINMAMGLMQPAKVGPMIRPASSRQSTQPVRALPHMQPERQYPQTNFKPMKEEDLLEPVEEEVVMEVPMDRRETLGALLGAMVTGGSLLSEPALALIPDDEDNELLTKAKANRKAKIQAEKRVERKLVESEGLKGNLERQLAPVQKAIAQLSKAGVDLEKNDVKAAASEINDFTLISELEAAVTKISNTGDARKLAKSLVDEVKSFQNAANQAKEQESIKEFKDVAAAFKAWADAADVDSLLKGL